MKMKNNIRKTVFSALFLALAFIIPFFTGHTPQINSMLCPMHIPIFLCGFICGWSWGLGVGLCAPLLRSFIFGLPVFFPTALCMAFELATYGAVSGILYKLLQKKIPFIYISLTVSMIAGRIIRALATAVCCGIAGTGFSLSAFISGVIIYAIPGMILHVVIIPPIIILAKKTNIIKES